MNSRNLGHSIHFTVDPMTGDDLLVGRTIQHARTEYEVKHLVHTQLDSPMHLSALKFTVVQLSVRPTQTTTAAKVFMQIYTNYYYLPCILPSSQWPVYVQPANAAVSLLNVYMAWRRWGVNRDGLLAVDSSYTPPPRCSCRQ
jgi:hypothetical protein